MWLLARMRKGFLEYAAAYAGKQTARKHKDTNHYTSKDGPI